MLRHIHWARRIGLHSKRRRYLLIGCLPYWMFALAANPYPDGMPAQGFLKSLGSTSANFQQDEQYIKQPPSKKLAFYRSWPKFALTSSSSHVTPSQLMGALEGNLVLI